MAIPHCTHNDVLPAINRLKFENRKHPHACIDNGCHLKLHIAEITWAREKNLKKMREVG